MLDFILEHKKLLIMWPSNTVGASKEELALNSLINIGNTIGFGRLEQLAKNLYSLAIDPNTVERLKEEKRLFFQQNNWKHQD